MEETRAIYPMTCSNCRTRIKIGNAYYRGQMTFEPLALCPDCYEKSEQVKQREEKKRQVELEENLEVIKKHKVK